MCLKVKASHVWLWISYVGISVQLLTSSGFTIPSCTFFLFCGMCPVPCPGSVHVAVPSSHRQCWCSSVNQFLFLICAVIELHRNLTKAMKYWILWPPHPAVKTVCNPGDCRVVWLIWELWLMGQYFSYYTVPINAKVWFGWLHVQARIIIFSSCCATCVCGWTFHCHGGFVRHYRCVSVPLQPCGCPALYHVKKERVFRLMKTKTDTWLKHWNPLTGGIVLFSLNTWNQMIRISLNPSGQL